VSARAAIARLEAYLQRETGVQRRLAGVLEATEQAVRVNDRARLDELNAELQRELAGDLSRERERRILIHDAARALGAAPELSTVSSLAERAGEDGARLERLRGDLRGAVRSVRERSRKLVAVARVQQEVVHDLLKLVLGEDLEDGVARRGALVDAEA